MRHQPSSVDGNMYELHSRPDIQNPVLILGLESWIDAGFGGVTALSSVIEQIDADVIATFESDRLIDYRSRRPTQRLIDGVNSDIVWPEIVLLAGVDDNNNSILLLTGPEPDMAWQAFSDAVVELALDLDVRLAAGVGAFPAPVPHTRPVRLAASASDDTLAAKVGFINNTVDVPAGIQGVLENALAAQGIPSIGIWARVPHYVAGMPYPAASAALIKALGEIAEISISDESLEKSAALTAERIDKLINNSDEHSAMVHQLEEQVDAEDASNEEDFLADGSIPTGDEIAAELERFLRGELS